MRSCSGLPLVDTCHQHLNLKQDTLTSKKAKNVEKKEQTLHINQTRKWPVPKRGVVHLAQKWPPAVQEFSGILTPTNLRFHCPDYVPTGHGATHVQPNTNPGSPARPLNPATWLLISYTNKHTTPFSFTEHSWKSNIRWVDCGGGWSWGDSCVIICILWSTTSYRFAVPQNRDTSLRRLSCGKNHNKYEGAISTGGKDIVQCLEIGQCG